MAEVTRKVVLSWSSGKDSAHALHLMRERADTEVVALLTTVNEEFGRVATHAVPRSLLAEQGRLVGLPVVEVPIPHPCPNDAYERAMKTAFRDVRRLGAETIAFADIFLQDIRDYRIQLLESAGLHAIFPIWGRESGELAREMIESGLRARLTCVDPAKVPPALAGRVFDEALLDELPVVVDPCGENGEFHTFVFASPEFSETIPVRPGEVLEREGYLFVDMVREGTGA